MSWATALAQTAAEQLAVLRVVLDQATDAVLITEAEPIDLPGPRILYANAAFTRMTGYTPDELIGQTPRIFQGPGTDRHKLDRLREALKRWQPIELELLNYRKDGSEFWVELAISPVANERGWYTHWIAVQRDITARKRAAGLLERDRAEVLERSMLGAPLGEVLDQLRLSAERQFGGWPVSITLGDADATQQERPESGWRTVLRGEAGQLLGALSVSAPRPATDDDRTRLQALSRLAELMITRDRARAELEDAVRRATVLTALGDLLQQALTPGEVAVWALEHLGPALGAQCMLVVRLQGQQLLPPTSWGAVPEAVHTYMSRPGLTLDEAPALRTVAGSGALYVESYHAVPGALEGLPPLCYGVEPLCTPDGTLQGFLVAWRPPGVWADHDRTLMRRAAETIGLALERAEQAAQLEARSLELRQHAADVERERTFLQTVLASMSEGVVACDAHGQLTVFNDAARRLHGPETGMPQVEGAGLSPEAWAPHYALLDSQTLTLLRAEQVPLYRAWRGETVREAEMIVRSASGVVQTVLASGGPVVTAQGEALGAVVTLRDVSARRLAEQQLVQSHALMTRRNAELYAANEELVAFAASASHGLRTPLRHVRSFADLARRALDHASSDRPQGAPTAADLAHAQLERARAHLERVGAAADRMYAVTGALHTLSASSVQPLSRRDVPLDSVLQRCLTRLQPAPEVQWRLEPLPVVHADEAALEQALTQLLDNALKFSRGRTPARVEVWGEERPGEWAVHVRDNGVGFEMGEVGQLFQAFSRLHAGHDFPGVGAGLALVRRVALRHGGSVSARAAPGQGATFTLTLPRLERGQESAGLA